MTTLLLNAFLVLLMIFFGAMAFYPLFLKGTEADEAVEAYGDDVVVSVVPAPMHRPAASATPGRPIVLPRPGGNGPEHPGHRPAA